MLVVGLTTLTIQIFPFALPLLVLVIAPVAVLGLAAAVLLLPILLPLWLARLILSALRRRSEERRAVTLLSHPTRREAAPHRQGSSRPPASATPDRLGREASSSARASTRAA